METTKEKSATFTPGPWELVQERDYLNIQETKTNLIVAQFCSVSEANARLIAAAPEMYKILREVLIDYKSDAKIEGRDLPLTGKIIREVLAKVDGGEG
mgnify:CR=1 FL=1